ncbi:LuxR family transcriptional regulator [Paraburkholderia lacunae]|uniref:LuxR family transcriptional regulator n=2 Tax=Paraburkholderia lacunae TaxID=2211104 RepID=A0A370NB55_9BURK|nr:LuxR family transcriptional regulator [Paraburkholderia lacunae]
MEDLFLILSGYAVALGYEFCCYGFRSPVPVSRRPVRVLDTYPAGWMAHYMEQGYLRTDPVVLRGAQSALPIVWSDALFAEAGTMWQEAQAFGIRAGISQSSWGKNGSFGVLSLARSAEAVSPAERNAISMCIAWLANATHTEMSRFLFRHAETDGTQSLTEREREILCWTSEGKSSQEVGMILNIAPSTVNFHINKILSKMGAINKMQAAVRAVALGIINN